MKAQVIITVVIVVILVVLFIGQMVAMSDYEEPCDYYCDIQEFCLGDPNCLLQVSLCDCD